MRLFSNAIPLLICFASTSALAQQPTAGTAAMTPVPAPVVAAVPTPTPVPTATASPPFPPGAPVVGNWQAWYIGTTTELVVVKNATYDKPVPVIDSSYVVPSILRRYLTFRYADFMQFGEQNALELAIDEACTYHAKHPGMPARQIEEVVHEYLSDFGAESTLKHPDKNTPYFVGAVLSTMVKPEKMTAGDSPARFTIVSAVASCKEIAGRRYQLAQKRAFNTNVSNNIRALTWLIEKWIISRIESAKDQAARDELKARSIEIAIKAIRLSLIKMRDYQLWLNGPEGKQLGGGVVWDAPLVPMAQAYARGMTTLLETQLATLEKEYRNGEASNPGAFSKIDPKARLQESDLTLLLE